MGVWPGVWEGWNVRMKRDLAGKEWAGRATNVGGQVHEESPAAAARKGKGGRPTVWLPREWLRRTRGARVAPLQSRPGPSVQWGPLAGPSGRPRG